MKQIHVLDQSTGEAGTRQINCVFWYSITNAQNQVPKPGMTSRAPAANVTAADQTALENGTVREELVTFNFPTSYTTTEMKALINKRYTDKNASVQAEVPARAFYGVFYDGTTGWSA